MVIPVSVTFEVRAANEADLVALLRGSAQLMVCRSSLAGHVAVDGRGVKLTVGRGEVGSRLINMDGFIKSVRTFCLRLSYKAYRLICSSIRDISIDHITVYAKVQI